MNSLRQTQKGPAAAALRWAVAVAVAGLAQSCAHYTPRHTPESVEPPASLEEARAIIAREEEVAFPNASSTASSAVAEPTQAPPSLAGAIRMALERNRAIEAQSYSPEITRQAVDEARAAFDPGLTASVNYRDQNSPGQAADTSGNTDTTGAGTESGTGTGTFSTAVSAFQTLLQEAGQIQQILEANNTPVTHTDSFGSEAKLSQPLPTGTEIYISGGYQRDSSSLAADAEYAGTWSVGVTQALLRGVGSDVNLVSLRTARNSAAIGKLAFRDFTMGIVSEVESAYWELALAQETLRIREFALAIAGEQLKLNEAMIAVGKLSGSARVSAVAEVSSKQAELVDAQAGLQSRAITLWQLLNPEASPPEKLQYLPITLPEEVEPVPAQGESLTLAKHFRPDLAQAKLDLANGDLAVIQTKNGLLPRLDAFVSYGADSSGTGSGAWSRHLDDDIYDHFEAGLTFSTTLGNRAEKARHTRAKLQAKQAEAVVRNLEQTIEAEVRNALVEVSRASEQITASYQEALSREEELSVETEQFRLGRSTNLNVQQIQQKLVEAKVQEATARVRRLQAVTTLYRKEGTLLTRRGVVLDTERAL